MPHKYIPVEPKRPKWLPLVEPTQIDWAMLAAYIDGEGHIGLARISQGKKNWVTYYVNVNVTNTNPRLGQWCSEVFGGGSKWTNNAGNYPDKPWRSALIWKVACRHAIWVLEGCQPYFKLKQEQAATAIAFQQTIGTNGVRVDQSIMEIREQLRLRMHELNGKHVKTFISTPLARRADARKTRHQSTERSNLTVVTSGQSDTKAS